MFKCQGGNRRTKVVRRRYTTKHGVPTRQRSAPGLHINLARDSGTALQGVCSRFAGRMARLRYPVPVHAIRFALIRRVCRRAEGTRYLPCAHRCIALAPKNVALCCYGHMKVVQPNARACLGRGRFAYGRVCWALGQNGPNETRTRRNPVFLASFAARRPARVAVMRRSDLADKSYGRRVLMRDGHLRSDMLPPLGNWLSPEETLTICHGRTFRSARGRTDADACSALPASPASPASDDFYQYQHPPLSLRLRSTT